MDLGKIPASVVLLALAPSLSVCRPHLVHYLDDSAQKLRTHKPPAPVAVPHLGTGCSISGGLCCGHPPSL